MLTLYKEDDKSEIQSENNGYRIKSHLPGVRNNIEPLEMAYIAIKTLRAEIPLHHIKE